MDARHRTLLVVDGVANLVLGVLLLLFPTGFLELLGAPQTTTLFYPTILGAVLFGIGVALFLEFFHPSTAIAGLGLGGAIAINLCGGAALLFWLLVGDLAIPLRGRILLWAVAIVVLGIGLIEIIATRQAPKGRTLR